MMKKIVVLMLTSMLSFQSASPMDRVDRARKVATILLCDCPSLGCEFLREGIKGISDCVWCCRCCCAGCCNYCENTAVYAQKNPRQATCVVGTCCVCGGIAEESAVAFWLAGLCGLCATGYTGLESQVITCAECTETLALGAKRFIAPAGTFGTMK